MVSSAFSRLRRVQIRWKNFIHGLTAVVLSFEVIKGVLCYTKKHQADTRAPAFLLLDLLRKDFSAAISVFRIWLCKNFSTYTAYMLQNFSFAICEIWKFRDENIYAVGLFVIAKNLTDCVFSAQRHHIRLLPESRLLQNYIFSEIVALRARLPDQKNLLQVLRDTIHCRVSKILVAQTLLYLASSVSKIE